MYETIKASINKFQRSKIKHISDVSGFKLKINNIKETRKPTNVWKLCNIFKITHRSENKSK